MAGEHKAVYTKRRQAILEGMEDASLLIMPGASLRRRNHDVMYPFRQNSDFLYLTGFNEPDAYLILLRELSGQCASYLFIKQSTPEEALWHGDSLTMDAVTAETGVDIVANQADTWAEFHRLRTGLKHLYVSLGSDMGFEQRLFKELRPSHKISQLIMRDWRPLLAQARLYKDALEIDYLSQVASRSAEAHNFCMRTLWQYQTETELAYQFSHHLHQNGIHELAYPSIVASGANACTLHYHRNNAPLQDGQLVLVDAGGELQGYAADITRTFPRNGRFTGPQRDLYELVLQAQTQAIAGLKIGAQWEGIQETLVEELVRGMKTLKILQGEVSQLIADKAYRPFYPHSSGHWLGLDVHDAGAYKSSQGVQLEANMVFTIEPGLYIPVKCETVAPHWRGMAVRIEDDILMDVTGPKNLSEKAYKTVADIEAAMHHD